MKDVGKRLIFKVHPEPAPDIVKALRPLSAHGYAQLEKLLREPMPSHEFNPGALERLQKEGLIRDIERPSPYAVDKGKPRRFVEITEQGRRKLYEHKASTG